MLILSVRADNDCIVFSLDSQANIELISFIKRIYWQKHDSQLEIKQSNLYEIIITVPVGIDCEPFKSSLIDILNELGILSLNKTNNPLFLVYI